MFHSVGFLIICRRRKNKAGHYSSRIVFDVKEVFMLYSENIQYHIYFSPKQRLQQPFNFDKSTPRQGKAMIGRMDGVISG